MKMQLINQIQSELEKARTAGDNEFGKHMYAIQALAALGSQQTAAQEVSFNTVDKPSSAHKISAAELKMMGGQPLQKNKAVTDDGFGNGDSLFDF